MTQIIVAGVVAFVVSIFLTPVLILYFRRRGFGQEIRIEGPKSHLSKSGTPTMGGLAIVVAVWLAYVAAGLVGQFTVGGGGFTASGLLVLGLATGLAVVGTVDDGLKVFKRHNKGLGIVSKTVGQVAAALAFAVLVLGFRNSDGLTPASTSLSYIRDFVAVTFPVVVFLIFIVALVFVWSNAVNFTDGLDGLAAGVVGIGSAAFFAYAYLLSYEQDLVRATTSSLLTVVVVGVCAGFLPHNIHRARMFMGDSGSMLLGFLFATSMISLTGQLDPSRINASGGALISSYLPLLLPLAVMALPFLDLVSAYIRRTAAGRLWFQADKQHLHHRMLDLGHSHRVAVALLWLWSAVIAFGVVLIGISDAWWSRLVLPVGLAVAVALTFWPRKEVTHA